MSSSEEIRNLYAMTPRPTRTRTNVKMYQGYSYYHMNSSTHRDKKTILYGCKERLAKKCPGRIYYLDGEYFTIKEHNHEKDDNENLRRLFKDELFEVVWMFPYRDLKTLYNEILEEYTDESQVYLKKVAPFSSSMCRTMKNWRKERSAKIDNTLEVSGKRRIKQENYTEPLDF